MSIAELLLDATADHDLLQKNRELGDVPEVPRDLDFFLYAKSEERALLVRDFISDNHYGRPRVESAVTEDGGSSWCLIVTILAPTREDVVCCLSGFMACLSKIYDLDYDGWGCVIQKGS